MNARQFLAEFSHIASAPNGVELLRTLILRLAVFGRLTTQDLSDRAVILLEDITKNRQEHYAQHHVRENKKLRPVPSDGPWELPSNWTWARFGTLCWSAAGRTPDRKEGQYWNTGDYPWFSIADLVHGKTIYESNETVSEAARRDVFKCEPVKAGSLLMSFKLSIGKLSILGVDAFHNEAIIAIHPFDESLRSYFFKCLNAFDLTAENKAAIKGMTLNQESISNILIALPPREEIPRIVTKVDELMALCDKLEAQQQERERLCKHTRKAALDNLVTARDSVSLATGWNRVRNGIGLWLNDEDAVAELGNSVGFLGCRGLLTESPQIDTLESNDAIFPLPAGWSWTTLRKLADYITSGSRGWRQFMAPHGDIFIRSQDIKYDALVFEDPAFVDLPDRVEGKRTLVRPGDLLITITGGNVGKCAQVPVLPRKAYVSQHVALVRVSDVRHTPFLHWWITNAYGGRKHLSRFIYGDKPGLNLPQVGGIPIPLPPQEAQDRIVEALGNYTAICSRLAAQVKDARNLAELLAIATVASITGIRTEDKEKMKAPKTELISNLRIGVNPASREHAPLAAILVRYQGELSAKALWGSSGMMIDAFYQQLKTEMASGWIVQPEAAYMKEVETA